MKTIKVLAITIASFCMSVMAGSANAEIIDDSVTPSLGNRIVIIDTKAEASVTGTLIVLQSAPPGVAYALLSGENCSHYIVEPSDLSLKDFVGKNVTISGIIFAKDEKYNTPIVNCSSISADGIVKSSSIKTVDVKPIPASIKTIPGALDKMSPRVGDSYLVSDVGQLYISEYKLDGITGLKYELKYELKNNGIVMRYVVEPSDADMKQMVGRTISITGYFLGRTPSGISVIQMKNASTFG